MGEYYSWVNVDKKQYIQPVNFDEGSKLFETSLVTNPLFGALSSLLANEWKKDHIAFIGDYAPVPENPDNETLKILVSGLLSYDPNTDIDGYITDVFQDVSGLFKAAEPDVRPDIEWMVEHDDFENNYYHVDRKDPFKGLFSRDLAFYRYVINQSRKEYFDTQNTRTWHIDSNPLVVLLGYGRNTAYYKHVGLWLGGTIEVSDSKPSDEYRDIGWDYNWIEEKEEG